MNMVYEGINSNPKEDLGLKTQDSRLETHNAFRTRLPHNCPSMRLDQVLSQRFKYFSRGQWQKLIQQKQVLVNGRPSKASQMVEAGALIAYMPSPNIEPEIERKFEVLYEDEHLLIINKPAPCPTTRTGLYLNNTLEALVGAYLKGSVGKDYWMMHRLDIETTGVVIITKSEPANRAIYDQFGSQRIHKRYVCVTKGNKPLLNHFQELPIGALGTRKVRIRGEVLFSHPGKAALTYVSTLQTQGNYHLLMCRMYTGRTHQIRIHLEAAGHWIVGDKFYYPDEQLSYRYVERKMTAEDHKALEHPRLLLHAASVMLDHPVTKERLRIVAPLKDDMRKFMEKKNFCLSSPTCHQVPASAGINCGRDPY